jgi:hypothetical protein
MIAQIRLDPDVAAEHNYALQPQQIQQCRNSRSGESKLIDT